MEITQSYKVAGSFFSLTLPEEIALSEVLDQYKPFLLDSHPEEVHFQVEVRFDSSFEHRASKYDMRRFNDEAPYTWLAVDGEELIAAGFSNRQDCVGSVIEPSEGMRRLSLYIPDAMPLSEISFHINNALMLAYALFTCSEQRLMVHASVIINDGKGYIFLGRSGTGKSTHARLWLKHIEGSRLLNDDNPVVYLKEGKVYVSGTPWSGKTPCYINEEYPLAGIVRLSQAPHNLIKAARGIQAYVSLKPSCSCMLWNKKMSDDLSDTVEKVVSIVPVWHLECLPDGDAAKVCSEMIR